MDQDLERLCRAAHEGDADATRTALAHIERRSDFPAQRHFTHAAAQLLAKDAYNASGGNIERTLVVAALQDAIESGLAVTRLRARLGFSLLFDAASMDPADGRDPLRTLQIPCGNLGPGAVAPSLFHYPPYATFDGDTLPIGLVGAQTLVGLIGERLPVTGSPLPGFDRMIELGGHPSIVYRRAQGVAFEALETPDKAARLPVICAAIQSLHAAGSAHQNLRPDTIWISGEQITLVEAVPPDLDWEALSQWNPVFFVGHGKYRISLTRLAPSPEMEAEARVRLGQWADVVAFMLLLVRTLGHELDLEPWIFDDITGFWKAAQEDAWQPIRIQLRRLPAPLRTWAEAVLNAVAGYPEPLEVGSPEVQPAELLAGAPL